MDLLNEKNIICIAGININLCIPEITDEYIHKCARWMNDAKFNYFIGKNNIQTSLKDCENHIKKSLEDDSYYIWSIILKESNTIIGNCALQLCDKFSRICSFGICIGEDFGRGKGYGEEVVGLVKNYAFEELNVKSIYLWVDESNQRAIKCYKSQGFVQCGRLKDANFHHGSYHDDILMQVMNKHN